MSSTWQDMKYVTIADVGWGGKIRDVAKLKKRKRVKHPSGMLFLHGQRRPPVTKETLAMSLRVQHIHTDNQDKLTDLALKWTYIWSVRRLQRFYRNRVRFLARIRRGLRLMPVNALCPITMERLVAERVFKVVRAGHVQGYDCVALSDYINSSEDIHDPLTRTAFNMIEMRRLHCKAMTQGAKGDVCEVLKLTEGRREEILERASLSSGVEVLAETIFHEMREYILTLKEVEGEETWTDENSETKYKAAMQKIIDDYVPDLNCHLDVLCALDPSRCLVTTRSFRSNLVELEQEFSGQSASVLLSVLQMILFYENIIERFIGDNERVDRMRNVVNEVLGGTDEE